MVILTVELVVLTVHLLLHLPCSAFHVIGVDIPTFKEAAEGMSDRLIACSCVCLWLRVRRMLAAISVICHCANAAPIPVFVSGVSCGQQSMTQRSGTTKQATHCVHGTVRKQRKEAGSVCGSVERTTTASRTRNAVCVTACAAGAASVPVCTSFSHACHSCPARHIRSAGN